VTEPIRSPIRAFIVGRFPEAELDDDEDIFALGFVNSLFAMELVMFIEGEFSIVVANDDLTLDNFRTITAMADLVERTRQAVGRRSA
jgi:methoxymalonate biosynthesis acyl carrier protein